MLISIKTLQTDSAELEQLVNDLCVADISLVESKAIKDIIKNFMQDLRDDIFVVKETNYVDRVFRDSYYDYYSTKLRNHNRNCVRLSFFDKDIDSGFVLDNVANIKDNYLGFLILRPQQKSIGRNVISRYARKGGQDIKICKSEVSSSCYGIKLTAEGFPHASQDTETMTCAQTTIWMLMEYFGNKYSLYKPTVSSEIEKILTPFVYERQLPSRGLTYNQVSVALREFGFGTRIYGLHDKKTETQKQLFELFACYIESGIPLAVALTNDTSGHAVVCVGHENIEKSAVMSQYQVVNGKKIYVWNEAVAKSKFVFNDDNFPCYQSDLLTSPCKRYSARNPKMASMSMEQFIAPLYCKVYMEADMAIEQSKQMVTQLIPNIDGCIVRTLLTSSRTFKEHLAHIQEFTDAQRKALLCMTLPKFVWVTEVSTEDQFLNDKVHSILLLDATGSQKGVAMQNMVYMLSKGGFYFFDRINKLIAIQKTSYATEFSAFEGNLK